MPRTRPRPLDPRRDPPRGRDRASILPHENLCDHCTGKCCRYFSLPIKTPETWDDYDEIRWFLAHGQCLVYLDQGTWYLMVLSPCQYLMPDNRCGIYHDRPFVCREYTTRDCEYDSDWSFDKVFEVPEQIWEYAQALLPPRRRRARGPAQPQAPQVVGIGPPILRPKA